MNETVILQAAEKIVSLGFKDLGYEYVVMDDCWSAGRNSSGYLIPDPQKFPNGVADVADKIHAMGLKLGIYSSAGIWTCARYAGSLGYEKKDADLWASWGVSDKFLKILPSQTSDYEQIDYLKYDNCYNQGEEGTPKLSFDRYDAMGKALNATGRPILYSLCNWGVDGPWNFATTIANSWRMSGDLINSFDRENVNCPCSELLGLDCKTPGYQCSIMNVLNKAAYFPSKAYAGAWNDLDMLGKSQNTCQPENEVPEPNKKLEVGNGGLTDDEAIAHFSLWAAVKSPLLMTNIMTSIDAQTLSILQNTAVLAVSQDPEASSAVRIWRYYVDDGEIQLYSGSLSGGDQLVVLLNSGSKAREMNATLTDIFWSDGAEGTASEIQSSWDVYDLWANRMSNATADAIIQGASNATRPINMTALGGSEKVYSQVPLPASKALMGSKVGTVKANGRVKAMVQPHGVAMLRLREVESKDEL